MSRQCWANPTPAGGAYGRNGRNLTDVVFVDSRIAPKSSPAPAGNAVVPAGWVRQIGSDGEVDTMLADNRSGSTVYRPNITSFVVPYFTGGWPVDPLNGQPGHTPQVTP